MYLCNVQIKQRDEQIDSLQQQIMGLERTRDRYVILNPALREFSLDSASSGKSLALQLTDLIERRLHCTRLWC